MTKTTESEHLRDLGFGSVVARKSRTRLLKSFVYKDIRLCAAKESNLQPTD